MHSDYDDFDAVSRLAELSLRFGPNEKLFVTVPTLPAHEGLAQGALEARQIWENLSQGDRYKIGTLGLMDMSMGAAGNPLNSPSCG